MKLAFLGTGDFGVPALRALVAAGHEIVVAISQPDRPTGRGLRLAPTAVRAAAEELGVAHVQTEDVNALDWPRVGGGAEIGLVAAFGQKLGAAALSAFPLGCVNLHASLLPKYRGAAPFQWAIINGDEATGVTLFQLNEKWDAGPIWAVRETPIGETETADELHDRLALIAAEMAVSELPRLLRGELKPQMQDASQASRAPKLSKADGCIDWTQPARVVARRINGLWSWPAAACIFRSVTGREERVQLARARAEADGGNGVSQSAVTAGAVCPDLTVQAGSGRVRILEIKPAGGKLMPCEAFANGRQVQAGDRFFPLGDS